MRFIAHQSCLALGLTWLCGSQMPGWGWRHQSHRGHKLKVNFWSHPQRLNPSVWLWGQGLYICISTHSLPPSTLCCYPLHHASLCLLLPPSCPTKFLREAFLLPSTLPEDLGLVPTKFPLLLNPETSLLTQSHWIFQKLSLREQPVPCSPGPGLASLGRLVTAAQPVLLSLQEHGLSPTHATRAEQGQGVAL